MSDNAPFTSRWGDPALDEEDYGWIKIPGWIMRNYHKCGVSPAEMMFIAHVMSFKYDNRQGTPENAARPSVETVAALMGQTSRNVRYMKASLIERKILKVKNHPGKPDEYSFEGLTKRCRRFEMTAEENDLPLKNSSALPLKNLSPLPLKNSSAEDQELQEENYKTLSLTPRGTGEGSIYSSEKELNPQEAGARRNAADPLDAIARKVAQDAGFKPWSIKNAGRFFAGEDDVRAFVSWYRVAHENREFLPTEKLPAEIKTWREERRAADLAARLTYDPNCPHCQDTPGMVLIDGRADQCSCRKRILAEMGVLA